MAVAWTSHDVLISQNQASDPRRNVHILHLKYRFQTPDQGLPMTRTEKLASLGRDSDYAGRYNGSGVGRTVPQPFSVVNDPVVKIDYRTSFLLAPHGVGRGGAVEGVYSEARAVHERWRKKVSALTATEDNGVFNPLPAQAVFNHIAKTCQPPPRIIVVSYVCSKATE